MRDEKLSEGDRGIDMMVYSSGVKRGESQMDATLLGVGCKTPEVEGRECEDDKEPSADGWRGRGKEEAIIRSRTERRSYTLRDRTQNGAGVPPGPGTTRHKQSRCTYGRVRTGATGLVGRGRVRTTMTNRRMNRFAIVSTFLRKLGKLKPVTNEAEISTPIHTESIKHKHKPDTKGYERPPWSLCRSGRGA